MSESIYNLLKKIILKLKYVLKGILELIILFIVLTCDLQIKKIDLSGRKPQWCVLSFRTT